MTRKHASPVPRAFMQACKHVMRYLATLSERHCEMHKSKMSISQTVSVEKKVRTAHAPLRVQQ